MTAVFDARPLDFGVAAFDVAVAVVVIMIVAVVAVVMPNQGTRIAHATSSKLLDTPTSAPPRRSGAS